MSLEKSMLNYETDNNVKQTVPVLFSEQYLEKTIVDESRKDDKYNLSMTVTVSTFRGIPLLDDY